VAILDAGGYARYDFKTATKLLDVCGVLLKNYQGDLNALHASATDPADLEVRLKALGKGVGDVTANIFLKELRGIWSKAGPLPTDLVLEGAVELALLPSAAQNGRYALKLLKEMWSAEGNRPQDLCRFRSRAAQVGASPSQTALAKACAQKSCGSKFPWRGPRILQDPANWRLRCGRRLSWPRVQWPSSSQWYLPPADAENEIEFSNAPSRRNGAEGIK